MHNGMTWRTWRLSKLVLELMMNVWPWACQLQSPSFPFMSLLVVMRQSLQLLKGSKSIQWAWWRHVCLMVSEHNFSPPLRVLAHFHVAAGGPPHEYCSLLPTSESTWMQFSVSIISGRFGGAGISLSFLKRIFLQTPVLQLQIPSSSSLLYFGAY